MIKNGNSIQKFGSDAHELRQQISFLLWVCAIVARECGAAKWTESVLHIPSTQYDKRPSAWLCLAFTKDWIVSSICTLYNIHCASIEWSYRNHWSHLWVILWIWRRQCIRFRNGYVDEGLSWELRHYLKWGIAKCELLCDFRSTERYINDEHEKSFTKTYCPCPWWAIVNALMLWWRWKKKIKSS